VQGLLEQIRSNAAAATKPKDDYQNYWSFSPTSSSASLNTLNPAIKRTFSTVSTFSSVSSGDFTHHGSSNSLFAPTNPLRTEKFAAAGKAFSLQEGENAPLPENVGGLSRPPSSCSVVSRASDHEKEQGGLSARDLSGTSVESSYGPGGALAVVGENGHSGGENGHSEKESRGVPVPLKGVKGLWGEEGHGGLDSLGFTSFNVSESAPGKMETMSMLDNSADVSCKLPEGLFNDDGPGEVKNQVCFKISTEQDVLDGSPKSPLSEMTSPSSLESLSLSKKGALPGLTQQTGSKSSPSETSDSSSDEEKSEGGRVEEDAGGKRGKDELAHSLSMPQMRSPWDGDQPMTSLQLAALSLNPNAAEFVPPQGSTGKGEQEEKGDKSVARSDRGVDIPAISAPPKINTSAQEAPFKLPDEFVFGEESLPRDLLKMSDEMVFGASLARGGSPSTLSGGSHSPGVQSRGLSHPPSPYDDILRGAELNRSVSTNSMGAEGAMAMRRRPEDGMRSHDDLRRAQYEADRR
jgi:hypothetical protein